MAQGRESAAGRRAGQYLPQPTGYRAFIPAPLPPNPPIDMTKVEQASTVNWGRMLDLAKEFAVEGPSDLAERHDHYAHGKDR